MGGANGKKSTAVAQAKRLGLQNCRVAGDHRKRNSNTKDYIRVGTTKLRSSRVMAQLWDSSWREDFPLSKGGAGED